MNTSGKMKFDVVSIRLSARAGEARCKQATIVLDTDLSKHAAAAQNAALLFAGRAMQIDCLSVVTPQAKAATSVWPLMVQAALKDLATRLEASGSRCELLVLEGDPHDTMARVAAERDCSPLVVGKHRAAHPASRPCGRAESGHAH